MHGFLPRARAMLISAGLALVALPHAACSSEPGTDVLPPPDGATGGGGNGGGDGGGPFDGGGAGDAGPDGAGACASNADCAKTPATPSCHLPSGACVECLPEDDLCAPGLYCDAGGLTCEPGCNDDGDCGGGLFCDTATHTCKGCVEDQDCPPGTLCDATSSCVAGCTPEHPCPAGLGCCEGACVDLASDAAHCGGCGVVCAAAPPKATVACVSGACTVTACALGFTDCNGDPSDGCEVDTHHDLASCGACDLPCAPPHASPVCNAGSCDYTTCDPGYADCNGLAADGCEVDVTTHVEHCGGCGAACPHEGGTPGCAGGVCHVSTCDPGLGDCDGDPTNGCETKIQDDIAHCGGCGVTCTAAHAATACSGSTCSVLACESGWGDCNGAYGDGCEASLKTLATCGACDAPCDLANASESCATGSCEVTGCSTGHGDCDGAPATGCETSLLTSPAHCGLCGNACGTANATPSCQSGVCVLACHAGYADCDGQHASGCETAVASDTKNCGACGQACSDHHGQPSCSSGACGIVCDPGHGDCDLNPSNGCETDLMTSAAHCGACQAPCSGNGGTPTCSGGVCATVCADGQADCDGAAWNGCEADTNWDLAHCGGCGEACSAVNGTAVCNSGACQLTCDPGHDDCDGLASSGCEADLRSLQHCGACGAGCDLPNATESCAGGSCAIVSCAADYRDCNGVAADGCEVHVASDEAHCGACGLVCGGDHGVPSCQGGTCEIACDPLWADCDSAKGNGCETPLDTPQNCGACNAPCTFPHASGACPGGSCQLGPCDAGWASCDGADANGCETSLHSLAHCGACNTPCSVANGTATCATGSCQVQSCGAGYGNCDNNHANGCETQLNALAHCGACNAPCSVANGTATCASGTCQIQSCQPGFANCDGNHANGCEAALNTNLNCGGCGVSCTRPNATASCSTGTCVLVSCNTGYGNCDGNQANGCEVNTTTSAAHCGSCGNACPTGANGTPGCSSSTCTMNCNAGWGNCDMNLANGCEAQLNTVTNCGACGAACTLAHANTSCSTGACQLTSCHSGWGNCDGNASNGCETDLNASSSHCGACGNACPGGLSCASGSCSLVCPPGTANCDGNLGNGCETNTLSDPSNCGGCGISCGVGGACVNGSCNCGSGNDFAQDGDTTGWVTTGDFGFYLAAPESYSNPSVVFLSRAFGTDGNRSFPYPGGESETSYARTGPLVLPAAITFKSWHVDEGGGSYDNKTIRVSVNNGASWTVLVNCSTGPNDTLPFCNSESGPRSATLWDTITISTAAFAGQIGILEFGYATGDSCCDFEQGWFIDDAALGSCP